MRFDRAADHLSKSIDDGRIPGGVLGWIDGAGARKVFVKGAAQIEPTRIPMTETTWFDLASLTKVMFTTEAILSHAAAGDIDLDAPLISVIPDLRQYDNQAWERQVTFRQCLGHQTPFPAVEPIYTYGDDPDLLRAFVLQREWKYQDTPVYSDINFILLGIALERLRSCSIRDMDPGFGLSFTPPENLCAATEKCAWRGKMLRSEVHDENCYALQGSGHAGAFGTVASVLDFANALLKKNAANDPHTKLLQTPMSERRALGWERPHAGWSGGDFCSAATLGHTGFTGTGLWIDFETGQAWTLLTNRVHPSRHSDSGIFDLRRTVGTEFTKKGT